MVAEGGSTIHGNRVREVLKGPERTAPAAKVREAFLARRNRGQVLEARHPSALPETDLPRTRRLRRRGGGARRLLRQGHRRARPRRDGDPRGARERASRSLPPRARALARDEARSGCMGRNRCGLGLSSHDEPNQRGAGAQGRRRGQTTSTPSRSNFKEHVRRADVLKRYGEKKCPRGANEDRESSCTWIRSQRTGEVPTLGAQADKRKGLSEGRRRLVGSRRRRIQRRLAARYGGEQPAEGRPLFSH